MWRMSLNWLEHEKTKNLSRNYNLYGVIEVAPLELRSLYHIVGELYIEISVVLWNGGSSVMDNQWNGELVVQRV